MSNQPAAAPAVVVAGLWHLGAVTAACLASRDIPTVGYDPDPLVVANLSRGAAPLFEPGLDELLGQGLERGVLRFSSDPADAGLAPIVWITWDTPVDEDDRADVESVIGNVASLFPHLQDDALVLISSQLPIGSVRHLERLHAEGSSPRRASFACSPENLRLGNAIKAFTQPERVVLGVRSPRDAERVQALLSPFSFRTEVIGVESAELTKHALNAFLATSVAFINEVARLGETVGADTREVERMLKSEPRIGPRAYIRPGGAYGGGTLARDINYLIERGEAGGCRMPLFRGVRDSNDAHREWTYTALVRLLGSLEGQSIAVLGLTYKPDTDTLRRSPAVDLCLRVAAAGGRVIAYDPAVNALPPELAGAFELANNPHEALRGSSAAVVATEWPVFRSLGAEAFLAGRAHATVIDPGGFLAAELQSDRRIRYVVVGAST